MKILEQLTDSQKVLLQQVAQWKEVSSPNGSHYRRQYLPEGDHGNCVIKMQYNYGYIVSWSDGTESHVPFTRRSIGGGVDLGIYFNTRDQALTALL